MSRYHVLLNFITMSSHPVVGDWPVGGIDTGIFFLAGRRDRRDAPQPLFRCLVLFILLLVPGGSHIIFSVLFRRVVFALPGLCLCIGVLPPVLVFLLLILLSRLLLPVRLLIVIAA